MFSSCALPERGRASATNVNKLTDFQYASLFSGGNQLVGLAAFAAATSTLILLVSGSAERERVGVWREKANLLAIFHRI